LRFCSRRKLDLHATMSKPLRTVYCINDNVLSSDTTRHLMDVFSGACSAVNAVAKDPSG
jgi:hypothetical protein